MSAETTFNLISVVSSALGLLNAADGFRRTFKSVAAPDDPFFRRVFATQVAMVTRWRSGLTRAVRRALRRPAPTITATLGTALSVEAAMNAHGLVQFGPLPDVTQEPAAFTAEVERRLNRVYKLAQDVQHDLRQEEQVRDKGDQQVASDLGAQISALDEEAKRDALEGLHEQVLGWFLVAIGLLAQIAAFLAS
ncbi:hypothetical protein [Streptomyces cylindrosporus]|uniref:Uncharacterized protein n=1 Tax=Streptomyces cylindrosporus TaxID=2927583 RepID=A0ABS9YK77_9ACTN|nr:hypothetical protein [Streptomyces cylindrosporus]MCI3276241.1 hypothetical protein [Streptomyces cylindrosporus]